MPRYDFRCRECSDTFVVTRPMNESADPAACPAGHADTVKLLTTVSLGGRRGGALKPTPRFGGGSGGGGGGGCCGGSCGCG